MSYVFVARHCGCEYLIEFDGFRRFENLNKKIAGIYSRIPTTTSIALLTAGAWYLRLTGETASLTS